MRLAFVTPEYVTEAGCDGGLANYLKKTAAALAARGCDVWIFVASDRDARWRDGDVSICQVRQARPLARAAGVPLLGSLAACASQLHVGRGLAQRFWAEHERQPFDVVQASSYMAPGLWLVANRKLP